MRFPTSASRPVCLVSRLLQLVQLRSLFTSPNSTIFINGSLTSTGISIGLHYHVDVFTCPKMTRTWTCQSPRPKYLDGRCDGQVATLETQYTALPLPNSNCLRIHRRVTSLIPTDPDCSFIYPLPIFSLSSFYNYSLSRFSLSLSPLWFETP